MIQKEIVQRLHRKESLPAYKSAACTILFFSLSAASIFAWGYGWWPVAIVCWLLQAHVGHTNLLTFHDAAHYTLHPKWWLNELKGITIGTFILIPLSAYRWVHNQHHLYLGTPQDAELWPFVNIRTPRWQRILAAAGELLFGFAYSPLIFLHGVLVAKDMPRNTARRLVWEYALCVAFWSLVLTMVIVLDAIPLFIVGYVIPVVLAGNLQSLRKFTEHMGLLGDDIPSITRTVVVHRLPGRLLSASMLHVELHGPHHVYPKIPHFNLPESTLISYEKELLQPHLANVFPSYFAAILDMLPSLTNPSVGPQWRSQCDRSNDRSVSSTN